MFTLSDLKQTRVYQEAKEEGKLEAVPRLLPLGLSVEHVATISVISAPELISFSNWLATLASPAAIAKNTPILSTQFAINDSTTLRYSIASSPLAKNSV